MAALMALNAPLLEYVAPAMLSTGLPEATSPPFQPIKPEAKESPETLEPMPVVWVEPSMEIPEMAPSASKAT